MLANTACGGGVIVIVAVCCLPSLVAVIVAVPTATPVTTPACETVAIKLADEVHTTDRPVSTAPDAERVEALSVPVAPTATDSDDGVSTIVETAGSATMTGAVPTLPSTVARMVVLPTARVAIEPELDIVAMLVLSDDHVTVRSVS